MNTETATLTDGTVIHFGSRVLAPKGKWGGHEPAIVLSLCERRGKLCAKVKFDTDTLCCGGWDPMPVTWLLPT